MGRIQELVEAHWKMELECKWRNGSKNGRKYAFDCEMSKFMDGFTGWNILGR